MTGDSETRAGHAFLPEIILGAVILIWASTFVITKNALDDFSPFSFIFARFSIVLGLSLAVLAAQSLSRGWRRMWHIDRADLPRFVAAGLFGYTFYQIGFTVGLDHTTPFSSSLLIANVPLFTLVIAAALGERYPLGAWLGVVVAVVGVAVFLLDRGTEGTGLLGILLSAGAAVSFATYGIVNRPLVRKYPPTTVSAYTTLIGTVPLLLYAIPDVRSQDWGALHASHWLMLVYMAVFPIYLVYIGYNWAIKQRGVIATSAGLVVPVVSGVLSVIVFDEAFGPLKIAGAAIVLVGLVLIQHTNLRLARRKRQALARRPATEVETASA
jgi:drug/metabolite transporter (DMT)-like permease